MERISEAEFTVMEVLWEQSPLTGIDVADRIPPDRQWNVRTVKTMLSRLLEKGVLSHEEDGRRYLYRPTISREDYVVQESGRLLDRMFGGRLTPLVAQLAERDRISREDVADIEALLKALKP